MSSNTCKTVGSLRLEDMMTSEDLLHIPTAWHNCVVKVEGKDMYYIVKSQVAYDALKCGDYEGGWVEGNLSEGRGGYFQLRPLDKSAAGSVSPAEQN